MRAAKVGTLPTRGWRILPDTRSRPFDASAIAMTVPASSRFTGLSPLVAPSLTLVALATINIVVASTWEAKIIVMPPT